MSSNVSPKLWFTIICDIVSNIDWLINQWVVEALKLFFCSASNLFWLNNNTNYATLIPTVVYCRVLYERIMPVEYLTFVLLTRWWRLCCQNRVRAELQMTRYRQKHTDESLRHSHFQPVSNYLSWWYNELKICNFLILSFLERDCWLEFPLKEKRFTEIILSSSFWL